MNNLYSQILNAMRTAMEEIDNLKKLISNEKCDFKNIFDNILSTAQFIDKINYTVKTQPDLFSQNRIEPLGENLIECFQKSLAACELEDIVSLRFLYDYYLIPLFKVLLGEYKFCCQDNINKSQYMDFYGEPILEKDLVRSNENRSCTVSIVLLAYNHIDYTKKAVNSILKYTKNVDYELILVNNGSSDETEEYFNSIENAICIHLKHNINVGPGFNVGVFAAKGKYVACVCNDFIFTHNWLSNLVTCIESDVNIGYVSPSASYISNLQQININFSDENDMHKKAKIFNVSNPNKWEQRTRLLPNVLMCPTDLLQALGGYSQVYIYGEFADDDLSYRIHRAGFKQIYCKDTWTHHFGHITSGKAQAENRSLVVSRDIFRKQWDGIDAWDDIMPDYGFALNIRIDEKNIKGKELNILAINAGIGGTPLQFKSRLKELGAKSVSIMHFTDDKRFLSNHKVVYDKEIYDDNIVNVTKAFEGEIFDYIMLGKELSVSTLCYLDFFDLCKNLKSNGRIYMNVKNGMYAKTLIDIMSGNFAEPENAMIKTYSIQALAEYQSRIGLSPHFLYAGIDDQLANNFIKMLSANTSLKGDALQAMSRSNCYFSSEKK